MSEENVEPETFEQAIDPNNKVKGKQNLRYFVFVGILCVLAVAVVWYIAFTPTPAQKAAGGKMDAETAGHVKATGQVATMQLSPQGQVVSLSDQLNEVKNDNGKLQNDNTNLQNQLQMLQAKLDASSASAPAFGPVGTPSSPMIDVQAAKSVGRNLVAPPRAMAGPDALSDASDEAAGAQAPAPRRPQRALMLVNATAGTPDSHTGGAPSGVTVDSATGKASTAKTGGSVTDGGEIYDSREFVPPNSYVRAKVLVGVDSQTGVGGAADPKPVLMRITSDAVGVGMNGNYQQTNLKGCLVNGAAWGELSSEKVYIKVQKITCQVDAHRFMTANVQGFVVSRGKAGVRGTVVSREGNLTQRAMIAGLFSGLGQAMSRNNQAALQPLGTTDGGSVLGTQSLSGSQIATSAVGGGIETAATTLSQYLIKRAEQYQPVIEMGTGVSVDIVFEAGFRIPQVAATSNYDRLGDKQASQNFLEQIRNR